VNLGYCRWRSARRLGGGGRQRCGSGLDGNDSGARAEHKGEDASTSEAMVSWRHLMRASVVVGGWHLGARGVVKATRTWHEEEQGGAVVVVGEELGWFACCWVGERGRKEMNRNFSLSFWG